VYGTFEIKVACVIIELHQRGAAVVKDEVPIMGTHTNRIELVKG
jgi:hypothetical protein